MRRVSEFHPWGIVVVISEGLMVPLEQRIYRGFGGTTPPLSGLLAVLARALSQPPEYHFQLTLLALRRSPIVTIYRYDIRTGGIVRIAVVLRRQQAGAVGRGKRWNQIRREDRAHRIVLVKRRPRNAE